MSEEERNISAEELSEQAEETASEEQKPEKPKLYNSQTYYVIKLISGTYIGWMGIRLIQYKINNPSAPASTCFAFGAAFATLALWLLIDNMIGYVKFLKATYEELKEEGEEVEKPLRRKPAKKEPGKPASVSQIAGYRNPDGEVQKPEYTEDPEDEDLPVIGAPVERTEEAPEENA